MADPLQVAVAVHADRPIRAYKPIWNWFGYDEPNYSYTANGRKLLGELAALSPAPVRVRAHNLLTSGDGTPALKWGSTNAYAEDARGRPVHDWTIMDRIFDVWVEAGTMPFVQVGFTPRPLSDHVGPYQHDFTAADQTSKITTGWAAPPNDLGKWRDLIEAWALHLAGRYGRARVEGWPWEVWNEPDGRYWTGTIPEFCALYDVTARAIKRILPAARVGGPHTCGAFERESAARFLRGFLDHVVRTGSPLDFVAYHAKGAPEVVDGHVRMGLQRHLRNIETNLAIQAEYPTLRSLPAILGESDPEGCAACSARFVPRNAYRNGPLYGVYVVESIIRTYELAWRSGIEIEGAVTWAFLFEGQPYFEGFRDLATNGIDKAVLNAFRMLGMLGGEWVKCESTHALALDDVLRAGVQGAPDVNAVATRDARGVSVLLWHYHDDDVAGADAAITLALDGWSGPQATVRHHRMDADHSNAYAVWRAMGSPAELDGADYARLERAGQLAAIETPGELRVEHGTARLSFILPRQGVSLIRFE